MIPLDRLDGNDRERLVGVLKALPPNLRVADLDWATILAALRSGSVPPNDAETTTVSDLLTELAETESQRADALRTELEAKLARIGERLDPTGEMRGALAAGWAAASPRQQRQWVQELSDELAPLLDRSVRRARWIETCSQKYGDHRTDNAARRWPPMPEEC